MWAACQAVVDLEPRQARAGMAVVAGRIVCGLIKKAHGHIDLTRQIRKRGHQRRAAPGAIPPPHTGCVRHARPQLRTGLQRALRKSGKGGHGRAGDTPTIGAVIIAHAFRRLPQSQRDMAAITPSGYHRLTCVRRRRGAPRSLRGCSGAAGFRCPFSVSALMTGSLHRRPACADRRRPGQTRGK